MVSRVLSVPLDRWVLLALRVIRALSVLMVLLARWVLRARRV